MIGRTGDIRDARGGTDRRFRPEQVPDSAIAFPKLPETLA
jgi:hypothetical protein